MFISSFVLSNLLVVEPNEKIQMISIESDGLNFKANVGK